MAEAQARILRHLDRTAERYPGSNVVLVTHAELIRAVILACRSLPLRAWGEVDVPYASITAIALDNSGRRLIDMKVAA